MTAAEKIVSFDHTAIGVLKKCSEPIARFALFVVFFWFGILKLFSVSPASPLVGALQAKTIPFLSFHTFMILFGAYEMLIGILFLVRGAERAAIALLVPHMIATVLPLFLLPSLTWQSWFVPTLEGQYIIKNLVIIALAISIGANLHPLRQAAKQ